MEAARDPLALFFLGVQCSRAGLAPLRLEPFHHRVEGVLERADLAAAVDGHALAAAQHVGLFHPAGEPLERPEQRPQDQPVHDDHQGEAAEQVDDLAQRRVLADSEGRECEHEDPGEQDRGVCEEDAPEQRHVTAGAVRQPHPSAAGAEGRPRRGRGLCS